MIFRARLTRVARGILCAVVALGIAWAIHAESVFYGINTATRTGALVITIIAEVVMLGGLWRLWVVCLIVNEKGVIVRNFRGDIKLRRTEIREVVAAIEASGCHVILQLKTGDRIHLDGLAFASAGRTNRAVQEITEALDLAPQPEPAA